MRKFFGMLGLIGLVLSFAAPAALAEDRAEWGTAVSVGAAAGEYHLLLKNEDGYHLVAVDPFATIQGAGLGLVTFSDIRPGDRVDYAVATWSGMDVSDMLQVTPIRHAGVAR